MNDAFFSTDYTHIFDDAKLEDHHALIPLAVLPQRVSEKEKNVWHEVVTQFCTAFMPPYEYTITTMTFTVQEYTFRATAKEVINVGWKTSGDESDETEDEVTITNVQAFSDEKLYADDFSVEDKKTKPKPEYTIDTLLTLMENPKNDGKKLASLGTPATRAEIIKKLFTEQVVKDEKKKLYVTDKGTFLLTNINTNAELSKVANLDQTTVWEEELAENPTHFVAQIKDYVQDVCSNSTIALFEKEKEVLGICPECGGKIIEGKVNFYCSEYKNNDCIFKLWKETCGTTFSKKDISLLLSGKQTAVKNCQNRVGVAYTASFKLEHNKVVSVLIPYKKK